MDRSKIGLVIPAFNEAATIFGVVAAASKYGQPIVVNDCSTDDTAKLAKQAGAVVVTHQTNLGYDGALNSGFIKAAELNCQFIITLDADGQHNPKLIQKFINELNQGVDVALGVRSDKPRVSEHLFALMTRARFGINDPLCGMKGYTIETYNKLGHFDSYRSIGTELMLFAARQKLNIVQIPFKVGERQDAPRFGNLIRANLKILRAMVKSV
jgi:glycosyltransferase involved in cell wall biosynthesis